jgi:hypothetical protein
MFKSQNPYCILCNLYDYLNFDMCYMMLHILNTVVFDNYNGCIVLNDYGILSKVSVLIDIVRF